MWQKLEEEGELVLTNNGKPIAVICATSEDTLEESLAAIRQARAVAAVAGTSPVPGDNLPLSKEPK